MTIVAHYSTTFTSCTYLCNTQERVQGSRLLWVPDLVQSSLSRMHRLQMPHSLRVSPHPSHHASEHEVRARDFSEVYPAHVIREERVRNDQRRHAAQQRKRQSCRH